MAHFFIWLAGFIDGEGTISITKRNPILKNRTYHHTYRAYLSIANTSKEVMVMIKERLSSIYGKPIGQLGEYRGKKNCHKKYYLFSLAKMSDLKSVLLDLEPHLIMKKSQARMVISFIDSRLKKVGKKHIGSDITADEIEIFNNLKPLNKRGVLCQTEN